MNIAVTKKNTLTQLLYETKYAIPQKNILKLKVKKVETVAG